MATSFEHHKKRIKSYKTSWAHLCQSAEGKTLWEMVACTPTFPTHATQIPQLGWVYVTRGHEPFPSLTVKVCFHVNFQSSLPVALPCLMQATFPRSTWHNTCSPPQCPPCYSSLATLGGLVLHTHRFLLLCPLNLPLPIAHFPEGQDLMN